MRHRAALGVTEQNDVIAIVVSEEKGSIRVSTEGKLMVISSSTELREFLISSTTQNDQTDAPSKRVWKKERKELVKK